MNLQPVPEVEPGILDRLRAILLDDGAFEQLLDGFLRQTVAERSPNDPDLGRIYRNTLQTTARDNALHIVRSARSSLERTFVRSVVLASLWNDGLGLVPHPTDDDAPAEIAKFRATLSRFAELRGRHLRTTAELDLSAFLSQEAAAGRITWEERRAIAPLVAKYRFRRLDMRYHMTMQARFPHVRINERPVIADIYFWVPMRPDINIIVECDGFAFHKSEERFTRDRKRDRKFMACGYDVMRFSGPEVREDPVKVAQELVAYLDQRTGQSREASGTGPMTPSLTSVI
jgi:very-short-patch-repair endonuclease